MRELTDLLADRFKLTEQERQEVLPSGQQSIFSNRVAWAKSHLKYAGLLENPTRGRVRISELGRKVLAEKPQAINVKFLKRFPSYCEFIGKSEPKDEARGDVGDDDRHRGATDAAGTDRRRVQVAPAGDHRGTALPAQGVLPVVLRVGGGPAADGDGLRRRGGARNGHGQVGRRRHRRRDQAGQAGPGRGVHPGEAVGRSGGQAGHPGLRRQHGLHPGQEGGHHDDLDVHEGRRWTSWTGSRARRSF